MPSIVTLCKSRIIFELILVHSYFVLCLRYSGIPNGLKVSILNWCCETLNLNEPLANDLLAELVSSDKPITLPGLLTLVADTLPRVCKYLRTFLFQQKKMV